MRFCRGVRGGRLTSGAHGSLRHLLACLSRIDVLVIDDWAMAALSEPERRDFWEICEDRYHVRSTVLTSLPVARWHEQIGEPTLADGILDRLVHKRSSYRDARRLHAQESGKAQRIVSRPLQRESNSCRGEMGDRFT
jgi:DNA replication protein DnaC